MFTGTNGSYVQAYNQRIVLHTIRLQGPVSRAEIARYTGLTLPTVSTIVQNLIREQLVIETGRRMIRRGKPPIDLEINPDGAYTIGLNLNRDSLTGVIVNLAGSAQHRVHYELDYPAPDEALPLMSKASQLLLQKTGLKEHNLWGIGVGFPGPLNRALQSVNPPNFPSWQGVPVVERLAQKIQVPIFLENNATAAAIGEQWYGVGKTIRNFFYVFFGVGLGGGLILDGHPYRGFGGNAGRFGHTIIDDRRDDQAHTIARLEEHVSLAPLYAWLAKHGVAAPSPSQLTALLEERHSALLTWLDDAAAYLALPLANIENYLDPEAIVFGGRLPRALLGYLIDRLASILPHLQIPNKPYQPKLLLAQAGEEAAALGAATLPLQASLSSHHDALLNHAKARG